MSVVCVAYQRKCDVCGTVHKTVCETARRTMAVTRRDGWQRRAIGLGTYSWDKSDVCPACLDKMESEAT